jgi:diguanylate cyclase (GGDEF)-like protein
LVTLSATKGILGYFWMYIIPILSFVAIGIRRGVVLSVIAMVSMAVVLTIWRPTTVPQPIEPTILLSFLLVSGFCAVYRYIHDRQQAQLERMSKTDQLTGLGNRRRLNDILDRELARVDRHGGTVSTLLVDLDDFKAINDAYGHPAGDRLLVEFSRLLEDHVRDTDAVIRYGGDEFIIVAPHDDGTETEDDATAKAVAGRIRDMIEEHEFGVADVSASVGIARYHSGESAEELLRRADAELYEEKGSMSGPEGDSD